MRIAALLAVLLLPLTVLADDKGPSQSALIWARDTVAERLKDPLPAEDFYKGAEWLNVRKPLSLAKELKGKIVLLDFWTYCCINCMHVLPDLEYLEEKYAAKGLAVVGVHSAKFTNEKDTRQIREAIRRYEIHHPVVNDPEFTIWRSYGARSWPTFALIAPDGSLIGRLSGEGRRGELEALIVALLERFAGKMNTKPLPLRLESSTRASGPLAYPGKVTIAPDGKRTWIADSNHNRVVEVDEKGKFLRAFGDGQRGLKDGPGKTARFFRPQGMAVHDGALYVCDTENHALRRIDLTSGAVTTVAGTGKQGSHYALIRKEGHGPWPGAKTALNSPWDLIFVNGTGYVCMAGSHTLWTLDPKTNAVAHFAGDATERRLDAKDLFQAAFAQPSGITWDGSHLYVADSESSAILRVGLKEGVTTIAGGSKDPKDLFHFGDEDGKGLGKRFQHPLAVLFHQDTLFVADSYNHKIKTVDRKTGEVRTLIGHASGATAGYGRAGPLLAEPSGLAAHGKSLYVANTNVHAVFRLSLDGGRNRELNLTGVPIPQAHAKAGGVADAWPEIQGTAWAAHRVELAAAKKAVIGVDLALPLGWKLTKGAPALARLSVGKHTSDAGFQAARATLTVPPLAPGRHELRLRLLYYICQDEGQCRVRSVDWKVIVTAKEGGPEAAALSDAFEP